MDMGSPFKKHIEFQQGCYLDACESPAPGVIRVGSSRITDFGWNYLYAHDAEKAIAAIHQGACSKTTLVFFENGDFKDKMLRAFPGANTHREAWLSMKNGSIPNMNPNLNANPKSKFERVEVTAEAIPGEDYIHVFSHLFKGPESSEKEIESYNNQYTESLKAAVSTMNCRVKHLTGYANGEAVSVASIYYDGEMACLYNVGTISHAQKSGYGKEISLLAVNEAFSSGVKQVFLQCEGGAFVENIYRSIGFGPLGEDIGFINLNGSLSTTVR